MKQNKTREESDVDELIALLNGETLDISRVESRSRRRRVDALLQAITQRPGQLQFNGGATAILQSGSHANQRHTVASGSFDIYAHTAFGPNTLLFIDLEAIGGNGPGAYFATFSGLNGDAGSTADEDGVDRLTVLEAWAEFSVLNEIFIITAGKIDLTNYFDNNASANDETLQFISGPFINNSAFAVSDNSPGLRVRTTLLDRFHFQFGISEVADQRNDDLFEAVYKIASLEFTLIPNSDFESNLRLFGYEHPLVNDARGWGISFDKVAFGSYNIFFRYGENDTQLAEFWGIKSAWSAGTRFAKEIAGHSTAVGLAFGQNQAPLTNWTEDIIEFYARHQLNNWTHISPHVQIVRNPRGSPEQLILLGVRTHFNF